MIADERAEIKIAIFQTAAYPINDDRQISVELQHSFHFLPHFNSTSGSAMAEGPRNALVSRNSATTKYPYRMALFA